MATFSKRLHTLAAVAVSAVTATALLGAPSAHAAATYDATPGQVARGADLRVPHIENGNTLVDWETRIKLPGDYPTLIAKTPYGYLVQTNDRTAKPVKLLRITADQQVVLAAAGALDGASVSTDGTRIAYAVQSATGSRVEVRDVATNTLLATRSFGENRAVVGVQGASVFLGGATAGTFRWRYDSDTLTKLARSRAYAADLRNNRIVGRAGGCTVLWRLGAPGTPLWRNCTQDIIAFNTTGSRIATRPTDRGGPVTMRRLGGGVEGSYQVPRGFLLNIGFESEAAIVMLAVGQEKEAWVRGWETGINRGSALFDPSISR